NGNFPANLPILEGKNWNKWSVQMKVIFAYQEVQEVVDEGYPALVEGATEAQRAVHRENNKKDNKAFFFNRVIALTNSMKVAGETVTDQMIVEKILRTLIPKFDHVVVAIEESKNLATLKVEELQGSL
ncbi:hypothetical protein glysoja_041736, partial [Glycine soja]